MAAMTFDTLEFSNTLQQSGFSREQADAMAQVQRKAMQDMIVTQELATKTDLERTKTELIERIAESKHEVLKWMMAMLLAQTGLIIAVIAFIK